MSKVELKAEDLPEVVRSSIRMLESGEPMQRQGMRRLAAMLRGVLDFAGTDAERAVRMCAALDDNGYICEKAAAIGAIRTASALSDHRPPVESLGVREVTDEMVEAALNGRVPGGSEVMVWLPMADAFNTTETARDVIRAALEAALSTAPFSLGNGKND